MSETAVELAPAPLADQPALWDMMTDYLIEHARKVDPAGLFDPLDEPRFPLYWREPERRPYWILHGGERAGFLLVNAWSPSGLGVEHAVAEFCVVPPRRRGGIGREAARLVFAAHPGLWELQVYRANREGLAFWPRAIAAAGARDWTPIQRDDRVIHRFVTTA